MPSLRKTRCGEWKIYRKIAVQLQVQNWGWRKKALSVPRRKKKETAYIQSTARYTTNKRRDVAEI